MQSYKIAFDFQELNPKILLVFRFLLIFAKNNCLSYGYEVYRHSLMLNP